MVLDSHNRLKRSSSLVRRSLENRYGSSNIGACPYSWHTSHVAVALDKNKSMHKWISWPRSAVCVSIFVLVAWTVAPESSTFFPTCESHEMLTGGHPSGSMVSLLSAE